MKTTESGYAVRIDLFFPCHPEDIDSMRAADHAIGMLPKALDGVSNVATVLIGKRKWIAARRKSPALGTAAIALSAAEAAQDGAAPEEKPASFAPWKRHGTLEEECDAAGGSRNPEDAIFSDRRVPR